MNRRNLAQLGLVAALAFGTGNLTAQVTASKPSVHLLPGQQVTIIADIPPSPSPSSAPPSASPSSPPTPTPTIAPSPSASNPADPWSTPFGTRPASGPIVLSGTACQGTASVPILITNKTFANLGPNVISINLSGCKYVTVDAVDFDHVAEGVLAVNSTNITLRNARYREILGPSIRDGHNRGNLAQFGNVSGFLVDRNKGLGGDTEDIISLYQTSNGRVSNNQFQGTDWISSSGTGIIIGDNSGGNNVEVDHNILDCPGQVGITAINGDRSNIHDNILYCPPRTGTTPNVAISTYAGVVTNLSVSNNRVYWRVNSGSENPFYWGAGAPAVNSGNNWHDATIDPNAIAVKL